MAREIATGSVSAFVMIATGLILSYIFQEQYLAGGDHFADCDESLACFKIDAAFQLQLKSMLLFFGDI
jgi:hypothetical protein